MNNIAVIFAIILVVILICLPLSIKHDLFILEINSLPKDSSERKDLIKSLHLTGKKIEYFISLISISAILLQIFVIAVGFMSNNLKPDYIKEIAMYNILVANLLDKECSISKCKNIGTLTRYAEEGLTIDQYYAKRVDYLRKNIYNEQSQKVVAEYDALVKKKNAIESLLKTTAYIVGIILLLSAIEKAIKIYRLRIETIYI